MNSPTPNDMATGVGIETAFEACPLCGTPGREPVAEADCRKHPLWQPGLPQTLRWVCCQGCLHVYRTAFFSPAGLQLLFSRAHEHQIIGNEIDEQRVQWADAVRMIHRLLGAPAWRGGEPSWLDVGCGSGGLVFTAAEFGFQAIGVDARQAAVDRIASLGYKAARGDLAELEVSSPVDVISLADVLEHVPFPREAIQRVHAALKPGGALFVSCPNYDCAAWRAAEATGKNCYWGEIEHFHNFCRASLMRLLSQEGFEPVDYQVSRRYRMCMEVTAVKAGAKT